MNKLLLAFTIIFFSSFSHAESDLSSRIAKAFGSCTLFDHSTLSPALDLRLTEGSQVMTSVTGTYVSNLSGGIVFLPSQGSQALVGEEALVMLSKEMVTILNKAIQMAPSQITSQQAQDTYTQLNSLCSGISTELDNAILKIKTLGK